MCLKNDKKLKINNNLKLSYSQEIKKKSLLNSTD